MDKNRYTQKSPVAEAEWSEEDTYALNRCLIGEGTDPPLVLVGIEKHFLMIVLLNRLKKLTKKSFDSKLVWAKLNSLFDLEKLEERVACPRPDEFVEFSLRENEYGELMRAKVMEIENKDSESGFVTVSTKNGHPVSKRNSSVSSQSAL